MRLGRIAAATLIVALVAFAGAVGAVSAESVDVQLHEDGDATVTFEWTYDFDADEERDAFVSLEQDEVAQDEFLDDFVGGIEAVADESADATGREMWVGDTAIELEDSGGSGVVRITVEWGSLAEADDGKLTLTEPFASGFETERLTVEAPEGYVIDSAEPEPTDTDERTATWSDVSLDGFEVVVISSEASEESLPGFGVVAALLSAVAVALVRR